MPSALASQVPSASLHVLLPPVSVLCAGTCPATYTLRQRTESPCCACAPRICHPKIQRRPDHPQDLRKNKKPSNGKPKGKHKTDSNQKPGGLRRKGPLFPSNSSTKLKDPWRISNPREEEGRKGKNREGAKGRALLHRPSLERKKRRAREWVRE